MNLIVEGLSTTGAGVGLALVHRRVLHQVRLHHKGLGAEGAGELSFGAHVGSTVLHEEAFIGEALVAARAGKGLVTSMNTDVLL